MLIGLPGSGKSFFARQFAEMFNAPLVSANFIRKTISPKASFSNLENTAVQSIALSELGELIKTKSTIIVDGICSEREQRRLITDLAKKHGYGTLLIWTQTDTPTTKYRSEKRNSTKKEDAFNSPMSEEIYTKCVKKFFPPTKHEEYVVISGKHTFTTQARVVLKKLVSPRESTAMPSRDIKRSKSINITHDIQPKTRQRHIN